jgi:hypothetical protein
MGLGVARPLTGAPIDSPLRLAALTLGGVMADAADVRGTAGRGHIWTGGCWPCCGDTMERGLRLVADRRDGEFWVRRGDTVAVGRSWAWVEGWAAGEIVDWKVSVHPAVQLCNSQAESALNPLGPGYHHVWRNRSWETCKYIPIFPKHECQGPCHCSRQHFPGAELTEFTQSYYEQSPILSCLQRVL